MKKTILFAMMAAVLGFTACVKEEPAQPETPQKGMILHATVTQSEDTKATFTDNGEAWHFDFAEGDVIKVTNSEIGYKNYYTFTYDGEKFVSADAKPTTQPARWHACFPSNDVSLVGQSGKWEDIADLYVMDGYTPSGSDVTGEDGLSISLSPRAAILKIINQKGSIDINVLMGQDWWFAGFKSAILPFFSTHVFEPYGLETKQTLLSTTQKGICYIAVPTGRQISIKDGDNVLKSTGENGLQAGKYYEVFVSYQGPLTGKFTVNAGGKQVLFSSGNLRYKVASGTWSFFDKQYECGPSYYENGHDSEISLFTFGYNPDKSIIPDGISNDNVSRASGILTQEEDWGSAIDNIGTWRTMNEDEWMYLFAWDVESESFDETSPRYGLFKYGVTVCSKTNCVVIAPDDWDLEAYPLQEEYSSTSSPMTWEQAEAAGLVCLPAAGGRSGSRIDDVGNDGNYWTSSAFGTPASRVIVFNSSEVDVFWWVSDRDYGNSVRLVTDVSSAPTTTFTVTFDMNGKTGTGPEDLKEVKYGSTITEPSIPKAKGYSFWGWYKDKDCTTLWNFDSDVVATDITLYAGWLKLPDGATDGKFSVANGKKVYFSQGNLTCDISGETPKWGFYENQYDCAATGLSDHNLISLFTWGYNASKSIIPDGSAADNVSRSTGDLTQSEDWGSQIGDGKTWRTLTNAEWNYLLNDRIMTHGKARYTPNITYGGKNGLVLYPDEYYGSALIPGTQYTDDTVPAGCVFLPATGLRLGSMVGGNGRYWTSSAKSSTVSYEVYFIDDEVYYGVGDKYAARRDEGRAVRLVTDCE